MTDRQTAIHEAGHAVVGRALGVVCGEVSIEPDGADHLGFSVMDDPRFSWERGNGAKRPIAEAFCIALYAGAEAERVILGTTDDVGEDVDCERATACLAWAGVRGASFVGEAFDRREAALRLRARQEVHRRRGKIELLATALVERRRLSGDEVDELL